LGRRQCVERSPDAADRRRVTTSRPSVTIPAVTSVVQALLGLAVVGAAGAVLVRVVRYLARADRARHVAQRTEDDRIEQQRERAALPGASPEHPLAVGSAAAVEPRAEALPCPACGEHCHTQAHEVQHHRGRRLRAASMRCTGCGHTHCVYFELPPPPVLN